MAGPLFLCILIGWVTWVILSTLRRFQVAKLQTSLQAKLLDRIDSTETLLACASTDAGRNFLESLKLDRKNGATPYRTILAGVQACLILIALGIGLLILHRSHVLPDRDTLVMATLPIALGIGFGAAAGATYWLSRSFGLIGNPREQQSR
jgi:hypothetical protein